MLKKSNTCIVCCFPCCCSLVKLGEFCALLSPSSGNTKCHCVTWKEIACTLFVCSGKVKRYNPKTEKQTVTNAHICLYFHGHYVNLVIQKINEPPFFINWLCFDGPKEKMPLFLGKPVRTKMDEVSEIFRTAFGPPPRPFFGKNVAIFSEIQNQKGSF